MFDTGKRLTRIEVQLQKLTEQSSREQGDRKHQETAERMLAGLETLRAEMSETEAAVNRHDRVIEDMLDAWEELREDQREQITQLEKEAREARKLRTAEAQRQADTLIRTVIGLYDQLFALRETAAQTGNEIWRAQIDRMLEQQTEALALSGIQVTGRAGDRFSYELHEAIQTLETDQDDRDYRLAEIIQCGYLYQGKVIRKARAAVWRMREEKET